MKDSEPRTLTTKSNLWGLSTTDCLLSPSFTHLRSSDRMSLGCAVSGSRVTATAERQREVRFWKARAYGIFG